MKFDFKGVMESFLGFIVMVTSSVGFYFIINSVIETLGLKQIWIQMVAGVLLVGISVLVKYLYDKR